MKAKLIKMMEGYIVSLTGDIDNIYAITNKELVEEHKLYSLSLKNCQEIESGYDLDELADELHKNYPDWAPPVEHYDYTRGVIDGAKTLLEILGDKKFSEEDMMQLVKSSFYAGLSKGQGKNQDFNIDDYVKEHLQQTEWDVEIEMICPHPMDTYRCGIQYGCDGDGCNHPNQVPYLDANGCLILKRKI